MGKHPCHARLLWIRMQRSQTCSDQTGTFSQSIAQQGSQLASSNCFLRCVLRIQVKMLFQVADTNVELQRRAGGRWLWACWGFYLLLSDFPDSFALGVLMWEVFSEGKIPYENRTNGEVVEEINAGFRLYKPKLASKAIYEVMSCCWRMVSIITGGS